VLDEKRLKLTLQLSKRNADCDNSAVKQKIGERRGRTEAPDTTYKVRAETYLGTQRTQT